MGRTLGLQNNKRWLVLFLGRGPLGLAFSLLF
jgi:hypothetical protein